MIFGIVAKTDKKRLVTAVLIMSAAIITGLVLTAVALCAGSSVKVGDRRVTRSVSSAQDALQVVRALGYEPGTGEPVIRHVTIPEQFDNVYTAYNELQLQSGFDLSRFRGQPAVLYCFRLAEDKKDCGRILTLVVCEDRLAGGDICEEKEGGQILSLSEG